MNAARADVLAFWHFLQVYWRKIWSTNPLDRISKEITCRTNVDGIFPNVSGILYMVESQPL
jgi:transposase-like protein